MLLRCVLISTQPRPCQRPEGAGTEAAHSLATATIAAIPNNTKTMMKGIHIGDKTHTQDQSICLVSLSTIKTIAKTPQNPMPPDDPWEFLFISLNNSN